MACLLVAAAAVGVKVLAGHVSKPAHALAVPARLGQFVRRAGLEHQIDERSLQHEVLSKSGGQASRVVSAVYQKSTPGRAATPQLLLFIGGHLSGVSPSGFITSFSREFQHAQTVPPGPLGGSAACASTSATQSGAVTLCTWADNDTFGLFVSPTLRPAQLAALLQGLRKGIEHTVR